MNWYKIFYWLTVADNVKKILFVFGIIMFLFALVCFLVFTFCRDGGDMTAEKDGAAERAKKWLWWSLPFTIILWIAWAVLPTKKDSLLIIAGGGTLNFLTTDSVAKQFPHEAMNYVVTELKSMAVESKVDLGIESQKDKILDEAKKLTGAELIEKMKTDSALAKIILNQ